jgi:hypothetical protein
MSSSQTKSSLARAVSVTASDDTLSVDLQDGRTVAVPLSWYPRLRHGTEGERGNWKIIGDGEGISWPNLDEDISTEGILAGNPSAESDRSLQKWLESRKQV